MGKPSMPTPPDPTEVAGAQTGQNVTTGIANAILGNVNQTTPYGSVAHNQVGTYTLTDPATGETYELPQFESVTTLTPEQAEIFNTTQGTQATLAGIGADRAEAIGAHLGTGIDTSGLPQAGSAASINRPDFQTANIDRNFRTDTTARNLGTGFQGGIADAGPMARSVDQARVERDFEQGIGDTGAVTRNYGTDFSQDRRRVEDAIYSRMNPSLERDRESLRTSLVNQGIREGTEAFDRAMNRAGEQANDARMQAILAGGQEQSRMTGLEAQRAAFQNQAQNQAFGQEQTRAEFARGNQTLGNQAAAQQFQQGLAANQFQNQAQNQAFGQNQARTQQSNAALAQRNAALGQQQGMDIDRLGFANQALAQRNAAEMAAVNQANQAGQMGFNADMAQQQAMTGDRQAAMAELFGLRNQPLNEISALMSGSQVAMPNFAPAQGVQLPTVDQAGIMMDNYGQQMQGYQQQMANWNNTMGGIFGLGANVLGGF